MKFGVFMPTTNNGYILSTAVPSFSPTVSMNVDVARAAEQTGFSFLLNMSKLRGYGGGTGFWDESLDPMALAGVLIPETTSIEIWGSVAAPTFHPSMAARMAATYDDASGGRFVLNVVAGWNKAEYAQMGLWPDGYMEQRYDYSREYIQILLELWSTGRSSRTSDYFHLDDSLVQPRPRHRVRIVVPGLSAKSQQITAQFADFNFIQGTFDEVKAARASLLEATTQTGRTVDSAALYGVIAGDTDAEAISQFEDICRAVDFDNAQGLILAGSTDTVGTGAKRLHGLSHDVPEVVFPDDRAAVVYHPALFHPHLVGSYDRVAAFFRHLEHDAGVGRAVLSFPDFTTDVAAFGRRVIPHVATATS